MEKKLISCYQEGRVKLWYWSKEHNQSLWYKSIRIIEQKQIGQWNDVVEDMFDGIKFANFNVSKDIMFIVENNLKKAKKYLDNADYVNAEKYMMIF